MLRFSLSQKLLKSFANYSDSYSTLASKVDIMTEYKEINKNNSEKRILEDESVIDSKKQKVEEIIRIRKRNYAILLGYLGKNYFGMQRNPGIHTVEEDLIKALKNANLIDSKAFETIQSINFQRAARTDKGVSAIRQVVSLKLPENPCKNIINSNLPKDIQVFGIKRVTKGFNSKTQCDARTYSYTMPTFAFVPENLKLFPEITDELVIEERIKQLSVVDGKPFHEYRLPKENLQRLHELLKYFLGTHRFHNFTSKVLPFDPRSRRYIMSFIAEETFIIDNMEFITLKVKGQSFMLHQIRKMIGLIIAIMRNIMSKDVFEQIFEPQKYDIGIAPSLGLMLNFVHYDYYDQRYGSDGIHETLDWADCEKDVAEFEKNIILKYIVDTEVIKKSMLQWLANLNTHSFALREKNKEDDGKYEKQEDTAETTEA